MPKNIYYYINILPLGQKIHVMTLIMIFLVLKTSNIISKMKKSILSHFLAILQIFIIKYIFLTRTAKIRVLSMGIRSKLKKHILTFR